MSDPNRGTQYPASPPQVPMHPSGMPAPKVRVPSPYAMQWRRHWSQTNSKMARYRSYCNACHSPIRVGDPISYHWGLRVFVHEACRSVNAPQYGDIAAPSPTGQRIPRDVLGPDSPLNQLSASYRQEAVRWVQFHAECEAIPGIHVPFSTSGVQKYLTMRARTTKCLPSIKCALKKMGMLCGHELHTTQYQQPSIQYQQIQHTCNELMRARRAAGLDGVVNEALGYGNFELSRVLASFDVRSYRRFCRCHRVHRMYLCISNMLYTGCIRFGLFDQTDPKMEDLSFRSLDGVYLLNTTWRKTNKSNRPYSIRFPKRPPPNHSARYVVPGRHGPTYISSGDIIEWYLRSEAELGNDDYLFPILRDVMNRRSHYMTWLRAVTRAAMPESAPVIHLIRPHGLRAGWATDRSRCNVPAQTLAAEGRWQDVTAMLRYIRTKLEDVLKTGSYRVMTPAMRATYPFAEEFE